MDARRKPPRSILGLKRRRATWPGSLRGLTSKWITIPVVTVTALALAFVTYGAITRLSPTKFSRGGPVLRAGSAGSGPSMAGSPADDQSSQRRHRANAGPPDPPRAARTSSTKGEKGVFGGPSAGSPSSSSSSALASPATGAYGIEMDGTESVHFGPLSICNRELPSSATLAVNKARGETPTSYVFDLTISGDHTERHIYRYEGSKMFLDFEAARVTCAGIAQTSEISFSPPELRVVAPLEVGASWGGKSGDADRTETYQAEVLRSESVTVAGLPVPTFLIETTIDLTGEESGYRLQRWWYAPSLGLPVRWYEEISASRSGATYTEEATFTVVSLP